MRITELHAEGDSAIRQAGQLLVDGFSQVSPHPWPTLQIAMEEVRESLAPDRISLVALSPDGRVVGWVGAIRGYDGNAWELHPLVVSPYHQRQGIGTQLVQALEQKVKDHGGVTMWLGSDDVNGLTSIGGIDVYPNPTLHLSMLKNLRGHPMSFYQKLGYVVCGMLPDANGFGKPDIFMAKRLRPPFGR
jgi:aminoglycoside 6'-N-acetyltransferase I